jgi:hypothetical protein
MPYPSTSPQRSPGRQGPSLPQLVTTIALLTVCCGCPPRPPSQEEQRQAVTSRWITVEAADEDNGTDALLDQDDLNVITNSVPMISTVVVERVRTGKIESEGTVVEAKVCGTRPEYLKLLEEGARGKLQQGRFLESMESEEGNDVIVLSDSLSKKLFENGDSVDRSVVIAGRELTVVGVVSDGAQWGVAVKRDAYVPLKLFGPGNDQSAPFPYDRFRFRVKTLDQVKNAEEIIQNIIERRHPDQNIRVRSFLSENK